MIPRLGPLELIVILGLALLIFGPTRIAKLGGELGKGIRAFQDGLQGDKSKHNAPDEPGNDRSDITQL